MGGAILGVVDTSGSIAPVVVSSWYWYGYDGMVVWVSTATPEGGRARLLVLLEVLVLPDNGDLMTLGLRGSKALAVDGNEVSPTVDVDCRDPPPPPPPLPSWP